MFHEYLWDFISFVLSLLCYNDGLMYYVLGFNYGTSNI